MMKKNIFPSPKLFPPIDTRSLGVGDFGPEMIVPFKGNVEESVKTLLEETRPIIIIKDGDTYKVEK